MHRPQMTVAEIAARIGGTVHGNGDLLICGLAKIEEAGKNELTFFANARYARFLEVTGAGAILVPQNDFPALSRTLIAVGDPYLAFQELLPVFYPQTPWLEKGIHATAVVHPSAELEADVAVGAFCHIGPNCKIGRGTQLFPHVILAADVEIGAACVVHSRVTLREGVVLGNRVVIQDGAVIGSDGFGFAAHADGYAKVPQLGRVVIEDDVEVGANTTIDRATLGETVIGAGTKLDNLIQVAHNVTIGSHTVIAAQTGISGSSKIGANVRIGGQVGIVGHIEIGDRVGIGAQAGIANSIPAGELVSGSPARSHSLWKRIEAALTRLPELTRRVRKLEQKLGLTAKDETDIS